MEYEIDDDPQGLPDRPDGDRKGGRKNDGIFLRPDAPARIPALHGAGRDEDLVMAQFGEPG